MFSVLNLALVCLASVAQAQMDTGCGGSTSPSSTTVSPTTISPCTLFYTPYMAPQIGPTSTVYGTMMTTQMNVVNCNYCQISNVAQNPMATGSFTTRVTSDYLLITQIGCIPSASSFIRMRTPSEPTPEPTTLFIRGAKPQIFAPIAKKPKVVHPKPVVQLKRQEPTSSTDGPPGLTGEALRLIGQLFTVLYSVGVVNSGSDLGETCLQLQSANAILDLARVGINATQAAAIVCAASLPDSDLGSFNQTLISSAAIALYGIQLAGNYTGTVSATKLCGQLDLSPLPILGVDAIAVQSFVCDATTNNATPTTPPDTVSGTSTASANVNNTSTESDSVNATANVSSVGTLTPFPFSNSSGGSLTWFGGVTGTGSVGSAVTTPFGTGISASGTGFYPSGNVTAVGGSSGAVTAGLGTGALPTTTDNVTGVAGSADSDAAETDIAPFPNSNGDAAETDMTPFPTGNGNVSAITGSAGSDGASFGTGSLPTGTGSVGNNTAHPGTNVLPTGTGSVRNGTAIGTGNPPAVTGSTGTGVNVNGTSDASESDGIATGTDIGASMSGGASDGYASVTTDTLSNQGGYGQESTERVPRGPTSTPRYYPKYF